MNGTSFAVLEAIHKLATEKAEAKRATEQAAMEKRRDTRAAGAAALAAVLDTKSNPLAPSTDPTEETE